MGVLLRQALTLTRLRAAYERVLKNHGQPGVDGVDVETFGHGLMEKLQALRTEVLGGHYRPSPLKRLWLPHPGKAPRPLAIPTVRDRVLHTAVAQTLNPLLEAEFEECSFAYRQGRSVRMAVERIGSLQRQGYRWVVEADIERFFDCIPHDRLLSELRTIVRDESLLLLIQHWLTAPVEEEGRLHPVTLGVPQGSPLSPLLSNLYLDHLDEALLDQGHALVRYADDFIILAKNRDKAEAAVDLSAQVLRDLELRLNPLKTRVVNFDTGFKFLGWNFVRSLAVPASRQHETTNRAAPIPARPETEPTIQTTGPPPEPAPAIDGEMAEAFADALAANPDWQPDSAGRQPAAAPPPQCPPEGGGSEPAFHDLQGKDEGQIDLDLTADPNTDQPPVDSDEPESPLPPPSLQRTLYLVDPDVTLATENHHLLAKRGQELLLDLPAVSVDQVMLFGRNPVTTPAIICCLRHDIPVAYLSRLGKFYGRLEPPSGEAVNLLAAQFAAHAAGSIDLPLAREIVHGKLHNSALLLSRYARHRHAADTPQVHDAVALLRELARRTRAGQDLDTLRGLEGAGSAAYFAIWRLWLAPRWTFGAREAQRGADPINALLDLGYSILRQCVAGLIQARGINPWLGHLHRPKSGHMALASDLMEEFRPLVIDAVVLNACLNRHLDPQDFVSRNGAWILKPEAARGFIRDIETRLNTERRHPHSNESLDLRRIIDAQIRSLAAAYRQQEASAFRACLFR
ncbi:MAG: CRISPR-associated endonuclease Cas1 [Gammaproteobacteria bacterium]|nr:CRISPR-associated endonuclease Cas1 [Gammaproteobacteria bacterium]MBU1654095.1 CRISPR-associated endonuclease Cas1 [Gammaproteobacteria bacterium]MBU1961376.1 CRISPR-associated endonuclease Cas1 [Gammaproteobacteria bacterium]